MSDTFDGFYDLSVSIPHDKVMEKIRQRHHKLSSAGFSNGAPSATPAKKGGMFSSLFGLFSSRKVELYDCLHAFCDSDDLTGKDKYRCEKCKSLSEATKTFTIDKPPTVRGSR